MTNRPLPLPIAPAGLLAMLLAAAPASAQRPKAPRHDAAAFVPCAEGATWSYRETTRQRATGETGEAIRTLRVLDRFRDGDGAERYLVACDADGGLRYEQWSVGAGFEVQRHKGDDGYRERLLAAPVGAISGWSWEITTRKATQLVEASLIAPDDSVTVKAGTFRATHVRIADGGEDRRDLWFARDVGLVLVESVAGDTELRRELVEFTPGADRTVERESLLLMMAPPNWFAGAGGRCRIAWVRDGEASAAFAGRFAIVDNGETRRSVYVDEGGVVEVLPTSATDWNRFAIFGRRPPDGWITQMATQLQVRRLVVYRTETVADEPTRVVMAGLRDQSPVKVTGRLEKVTGGTVWVDVTVEPQ